jgi:adenylate cyclase
VVGNMGSAQRFNYTVMGDNVNLASRMEGLNKDYGTHILISEPTLTAARKGLKDDDAYAVREVDSVRVKGKKDPVRLFELRSRGAPPREELPLLEGYAGALVLYRAQRFSEARLQFESLLESYPGDGPATLMLSRCMEMSQSPPGEDWDGVFKMEHK